MLPEFIPCLPRTQKVASRKNYMDVIKSHEKVSQMRSSVSTEQSLARLRKENMRVSFTDCFS